MTVTDIIAKWGSTEKFSRALGLKNHTHGRTMRRRNSIPRGYWDEIVRLSALNGTPVTITDLEMAHLEPEVAA